MNKGQKYISTVLMLSVVLLFQFVQLNSVHYHKLANGRIIKHAHLYHKTSDSNQPISSQHTHTRAEFLLLQSFDSNTIDDILFDVEILTPSFVLRDNCIVEAQCAYAIHYRYFGLRAPPVA